MGGHEGGALFRLTEETPESSFALSSQAHSKKLAGCEPGRRLSPDTRSASTLISDFPDLSAMRNKHLLLNHPVDGISVLAVTPTSARSQFCKMETLLWVLVKAAQKVLEPPRSTLTADVANLT